MSKLLVATIGHITAGKTTILRAIAGNFEAAYISEGAIKRHIVEQNKQVYNYKNSLSEDLRDQGYRQAICESIQALKENDLVLLDASFHRAFRREWLYVALRENGLQDVEVLWLVLSCNNKEEVERRISNRARDKIKTADNQADHIDVYLQMEADFDPVGNEIRPSGFCSSVVSIDTYQNKILKEAFDKNAIQTDHVYRFLTEEYLHS